MVKIKFQRIWSKSNGIRHRMVYRNNKGYYIKSNFKEKLPIVHIGMDLWKIKGE